MRTFKEFPETSTCPICGKNTNKECVLIGMPNTQKGNIIEAKPVHLECVPDLMFGELSNEELVYGRIKNKIGIFG